MLISRQIKFTEQCNTCRNRECASKSGSICKQYKDGQYCFCYLFAPGDEKECKYYIDINAPVEEPVKRSRKKKDN